MSTKPTIFAGESKNLPFDRLTPEDYERVCFLYLDKTQNAAAYLFGGTKDKGRDVLIPPGHVFQCKKYNKNVGSISVVTSLLKLAAYQMLGDIVEVNEVTFMISPNLTNPALELITNPNLLNKELRKHAQKLLEKTVKPTDGLQFVLNMSSEQQKQLPIFLKSWSPKVSEINATKLSLELSKHPEIVNQFFQVEKVVALNDETKEIFKHVMFDFLGDALSSKIEEDSKSLENAPKPLQALIQELQNENPNLHVTATVNDDVTNFIFNNTNKDKLLPVMSFTFQKNNPQHLIAQEKLKSFLEEGSYLELNESDVDVASLLKGPIEEMFSKQGTIQLSREVKPTMYKSRLFVSGTKINTKVDLEYKKINLSQTSIVVRGNNIPLFVETIYTEGSNEIKIRYNCKWDNASTTEIIETYKILLGYLNGSKVTVKPRDRSQSQFIIPFSRENIKNMFLENKSSIEDNLLLMSKLSRIEDYFDVHFEFEEVTEVNNYVVGQLINFIDTGVYISKESLTLALRPDSNTEDCGFEVFKENQHSNGDIEGGLTTSFNTCFNKKIEFLGQELQIKFNKSIYTSLHIDKDILNDFLRSEFSIDSVLKIDSAEQIYKYEST